MYRRNYLIITPLLCVLLIAFKADGQLLNDSAFYNKSLNNIKSLYFSTLKEKALLYNGFDYTAYGSAANGSPFFPVDTLHKGEVFYDGVLYEDVPLRYDIVSDVLQVKYPKDNNTVQLLNDKVAYFFILGHQFVRLNETDLNSEPPGFYELLYRDEITRVLARRFKKLVESTNFENKSAFTQYDQYFIYRNGNSVTVNSDDDLVKAFSDKAQDIKRFIRGEQLNFKNNREKAIVNTAFFYSSLSK